MRIYPQNQIWKQLNLGEKLGDILSSHNIHFDDPSFAQVSPKSTSIYSTNDEADFQMPISIVFFDNQYYIVTSDNVYSIGSSLTFTEYSASAPSLGVNSDAVVWQNRLYVSNDDNLSYLNTSGSWTNSLKSLTTSKPHPIEVMGNFSNGHLTVGNGNTVLRLDTSHNTVVTLTINNDYQIECMKYFQNNLYIGTRSINGRDAKIFVWNGSGTSAQAEYSARANWVFALEEFQSSVVAVTSEGQILRFDGGGFASLGAANGVPANFPVYYSPYRWTSSATRVQRRGIKADGGLLYINIQGAVSKVSDFFYLPQQPSGIWCYDPDIGLYCRHLSTTDSLVSVSVSSLSDSTLTLASSTLAVTGEPVLISNAGSLTGVTANSTYYIIKVSDTTIKLAETPANAKNSDFITLGGSAGSAVVKLLEYNQYGEKFNDGEPGAIGLVHIDPSSPRIFPEIIRSGILWGFELGSIYYLNCLTVGRNIGGFTLIKSWASQVKNSFQKAVIKYSGLNLDGESIKVKARSKDRFGLPTDGLSGTYSNQKALGSDADISFVVEEGDNVNILSGNGSGMSVNVDSRNGNELMIDETILSATSADTVSFSVDNFKEKATIDDTSKNIDTVTLEEKGSWCEVMVELEGQKTRIEEIQVIEATHTQSK